MENIQIQRRKFLKTLGLTGIVLASNQYGHAGEEKQPIELRDDPYILEIVPPGIDYIGEKGKREDKKLAINDMKFLGNPKQFPKEDLDEILAGGNAEKPDPRKETPEGLANIVDHIFKKNALNLTAIFRVAKNGMYNKLFGAFLNPNYILTTFYETKSAIENQTELRYLQLSEKSSELSSPLEVIAYSPSRDLSLLYCEEPNKKVRKLFPKIASEDPYLGERMFSFTRKFPEERDFGEIANRHRKTPSNQRLPVVPNNGLKLTMVDEKLKPVLTCGFKNAISIGYAHPYLIERQKLQVDKNKSAVVEKAKRRTLAGEIIEHVLPAMLEIDTTHIGSMTFDSNGHACGPVSSLIHNKGYSGYVVSPSSTRTFLESFRNQLMKK